MSGDRRDMVADAAITVLAGGGARSLSHHAVDRAAGLAVGSTSYYFRTRRELIVATIGRIRQRSRAAFSAAPMPPALTEHDAAVFIAGQLELLVGDRRDEALAVFSLLPEIQDDPDLCVQLSSCLFSREPAEHLLSALGTRDPVAEAFDLIDLLVGMLFGMLFGTRSNAPAGATSAATVERFLTNSVAAAANPSA